jgi:opacity protein-like surface antigen
MTRARAALIGMALVLFAPAEGSASGLEFRFGGFFPRGESDLFADVDELFGAQPDDFTGFTGGVEYAIALHDKVEVGLHLDGYGRSVQTEYRDFVHEDGTPIFQDLQLAIVPIGATVRLLPLGRRARVSPYLAGGGGVYIYEYQAQGEFIDFFTDDLEVGFDAFESTGAALGWHASAGLRVAVSPDFSVTGEYRYQRAEDDMDGDFSLNRIDLGGSSVTVGFHIRF